MRRVCVTVAIQALLVAASPLTGCGGSQIRVERRVTAETSDIRQWLNSWSGAPPRVAFAIETADQSDRASCEEVIRQFRLYIVPEAAVATTIRVGGGLVPSKDQSHWVRADNYVAIRANGKTVLNEKWTADSARRFCEDALARTFRVFAEMNKTDGAVASSPATSRSSSDPGNASTPQTLFQSGTAHYNLGEYKQALTDFMTAYRMKTDPALLFNIAQCHRGLGDPASAAVAYRSYRREVPEAPNRVEVDRLILAMDKAAADQHSTQSR